MDKEVIKLILENKQITDVQLNTFITEYVKLMKDKEVTSAELLAINQLVRQGGFNLPYAANLAGISLGLNITSVYNKNGQITRVIVLE